MIRLVIFMATVMALTGCEQNSNRIAFDGAFFKAKARQIEDADLSMFTVEVARVSQTLEGARQAAAHEGLRYCIDNFGTSRIRWVVGPETPVETLRVVDDTLTFQGECNP